jgi:aminoglycoside 3-N-acetyltransferase
MTSSGYDILSLTTAIRSLGIVSGDILLVHSSLRSIGWVEGGADVVVQALLDSVAPDGTVVFPALTGASEDSPTNLPHCDFRERTTWCGQIPLAALRHPGHIRSIHPTHSVAAIGPQASLICEGHLESTTPCGNGSPYTKLADLGGKILLLGVGHDSNTTIHTAEELVGAPYVSYPGTHDSVMIDNVGKSISVTTPIHRWDRPRCFGEWDGALRRAGVVNRGSVGDAECRIMHSDPLIAWLSQLLRRNPRALLADGVPYR